jgi:hypothetical protein
LQVAGTDRKSERKRNTGEGEEGVKEKTLQEHK